MARRARTARGLKRAAADVVTAALGSRIRSVPTAVRLWAATGLCTLALGLPWSLSAGYLNPGFVLYGDCGYTDNTYCTPDTYVPGSYTPGHTVLTGQSPARLFVVVAIAALAACAVLARTARTRQLARAGVASAGIGAVLALSARATLPLICLVLAVVLVSPAVFRPSRCLMSRCPLRWSR